MTDKPLQILLVEDEAAHAELIQRAFMDEAAPVNLTVVSSLQEAHRAIARGFPDLLIVDFLLPDGRGIDLLPADKEQADYPVVIMTSHGDEEVAVLALKGGALDYVVKSDKSLLAMPRIAERALRAWGYIADRKRAEKEVRLLSTAIEQTADSVLITDVNGVIVYVNAAFEQVSGYNRAEVLGQTPAFLKSGQHDARFYNESWASLSQGKVWRGRFTNRKKNDTLYTVEATITPARDESGQVVNYVSAQRDVTHELILEEKLRQAQKMEAVGRLAGGVAHDFNNILTVITGYTELLLTRHADNPENQNRALQQIELAAERAASLTRQLLAFSRKQILQPKMLNLNSVVTDINMMLRRLIGEDIELIMILEPQLGQVLADPGQLEQVILNLAVNARDAMPRGGKLTLQTANIELDGSDNPRDPDVGPGPYVSLTVSDTGHGMTKEVQAHIFEPFFTTKEVGKGTGLGLATVHGIVKQSDGYIWVESEAGLGTTFNVYLPRLKAAETPKGEETPQQPARGTETILLVEDEEQVRDLAHRILEMNGYHVLAAPNGPEALTLVDQEPGPIDLLLTDVIMPGGLNGLELAQHLLVRRPQLKVIYMSGYTDDVLIDRSLFTPGFAFLQKPFNAAGLTGKLREVMNTREI